LLHFLLDNLRVKRVDSFRLRFFSVGFWSGNLYFFKWSIDIKVEANMNFLNVFVETAFVIECFLTLLDRAFKFLTLVFSDVNLFMLFKVR
jgi:hypothetical protein